MLRVPVEWAGPLPRPPRQRCTESAVVGCAAAPPAPTWPTNMSRPASQRSLCQPRRSRTVPSTITTAQEPADTRSDQHMTAERLQDRRVAQQAAELEAEATAQGGGERRRRCTAAGRW